MKVLLVGFEPSENITYPHMKQVADYIASIQGDYFCFHERGYFLDDYFKISFSNLSILVLIYKLSRVACDFIKLIEKRFSKKYDVVIAVDNLPFAAASLLFKNVVLWSHDFVTDDQPRSHSRIQRLIKQSTIAALQDHGRAIIQDADRLKLFCETHFPQNKMTLNVFILPVSLLPRESDRRGKIDRKPIVLQIGGINAWRSLSDQVLTHYQQNSNIYDLALHGHIDKNIAAQISQSQVLPWISNFFIAADTVYKMVEKCDIGLIAYNASDKNFYYISKASGQLVEFLRCGKPVIVFGNTSLQGLVVKKQIGAKIDDISQLNEAVMKIKTNYKFYSQNALNLYDEEYNLNNFLTKLQRWLAN